MWIKITPINCQCTIERERAILEEKRYKNASTSVDNKKGECEEGMARKE